LMAMKNQGYISEELKVKSEKLKVEVLPPKTSIRAPHFVFYTKNQLEDYYGIKTVEEGGLKVTTTLDNKIQEESEKILKEELDKISYLNVSNGAMLITRPATGEILAMVGSYDYFTQPSGAFNVTTALRQPGSSIKPIMYSLALQKGYTAASILDDSPVVFNIAGSESYRPVNYDNKFHGKVPLRYALANSYNIPAVKTLNNLGVDSFIDFATKMGISTWEDKSRYGLSLTLGGGEVTMIDMAEAFGVLANLGYKIPINYFQKIEDNNSNVLRKMTPFKIKEIDPAIAFIVNDILSDNFARISAFGTRSSLEIPGYKVAVKTGTTNDKKDNWTIGYTPEFLVAVWVGNNDNSPMNPYLTSGITGAAPIWNRVMSYLLKNYGT
ncbi:MAG: penicillin-binding transpeptidase domain-containing protein, partial [Patescibacteria group bacterium]